MVKKFFEEISKDVLKKSVPTMQSGPYAYRPEEPEKVAEETNSTPRNGR